MSLMKLNRQSLHLTPPWPVRIFVLPVTKHPEDAVIPRRGSMRRSAAMRGCVLFTLVAAALALVAAANSATYTVTSTGDAPDASTTDGVCADGSGACTLRAAIQQANANANAGGPDRIHFGLAVPPYRIAPATDLPAVIDAVVVDGTSQPGFLATPIVELDGVQGATCSAQTPSLDGLLFSADGNTVKGLVVHGFCAALRFTGSDGNRIVGNFIGTDVSGRFAMGNASTGIDFNSSADNVVGGRTPGERNVIAASRNWGIRADELSHRNVIEGNYIGTDVTGETALGGGGISLNSSENRIGAGGRGAGNPVSGHDRLSRAGESA